MRPPTSAGWDDSPLSQAFHRPLRTATAALALVGALLSMITAVLAIARLGAGQSLAFVVVAVAGTGLAAGVWRGARWAVRVSSFLLGAQLGAVVGTVWQLAVGIDAGKARQLHQLGFSPTVGVVVNLVY